jgi:hypothetical protein
MYSLQTHIVNPIHGNIRPEYIDVVPDSVVFKVNPREISIVQSAVYLFPDIEIGKVERC